MIEKLARYVKLRTVHVYLVIYGVNVIKPMYLIHLAILFYKANVRDHTAILKILFSLVSK